MKTAREIIAAEAKYVTAVPADWLADAILAALTAEGFSIVETGRVEQLTEKAIVGEYMWAPKELHEAIEETIEACAKVAEEMEPEPFIVKGGQSGDEISFGEPNKHRIAASIRALSRSTREGEAMSRHDAIAYPPRGLCREEAARYVGVGITLFDEMVADGRMPKPKRANSRVVWDRIALDAAFTDLPGDEGNMIDALLRGRNRAA